MKQLLMGLFVLATSSIAAQTIQQLDKSRITLPYAGG
jgi:hypothetical protein